MSTPAEKIQELLTAPKLHIKDVNSKQHKHPAVYALHHKKSGKIYGGRTGCLYNRILHHKLQLSKGEHVNVNVQAAYDADPEFDVSYVRLSKWKDAPAVEQALLDHLFSQNLQLNIALDSIAPHKGRSRSVEAKLKTSTQNAKYWNSEAGQVHLKERASRLWSDEAYRKKVVDAATLSWSQRSDLKKEESARKRSVSIKRKYQDQAYLTKIIAAAAAKKKRVSCDGVIYNSVAEASVGLGIKRQTVRDRTKSPRFPEYFFLD